MRAGAMGVSVIMVVFLSVEWGGSTCLAAGCRPFFVSRVLGVAGAEVSEVGPLIGAYAFELGEKRLNVAGCRGDGAHAAGEGFAAVDAAAWALAGGLCADVGEVVPEGVGVAAVEPLVDAGDRGAALGGLVADVGDDGAGFVLGGGMVGEAVEDDADGAGFRGFRTLGARRALSLVNHGARGAPLLVRRTPLLTLGVVLLFLLAAPRSRRRRSFRARGKKRKTFVLFDLRIVPPRFSGVRTPGFWGTYPAFPGYGATCGFPGLSGARLLLPLPPLVDRRAHLLGCPAHGLRVAGDLLERGQEVSEPVRLRSAGRRVEPDGVGVPRLHAADGGGAFADDVGLDEFVEVGGDGFALGEAEDDGEQVE
ncbi:hypothetical protein P1312_054 [Thermobifida phage P1312]|nr:hypothetical protein P1312_054 [Thermobifida phage P1312]